MNFNADTAARYAGEKMKKKNKKRKKQNENMASNYHS